MLTFFYDFIVFLISLVLIPRWMTQKKYRGTLLERLGLRLPQQKPPKKQAIWIHMVSVGETRAMIPIYQALCKAHPEIPLYLSSTTKTGHQEAKKSLPGAAGYFMLPLDISWIMRRVVDRIQPKILFLSEGDFWYHMSKSVKNKGGKVILLNGKISEKSFARFSKASWAARKLFDQIDLFCLQNREYENRFLALKIPQEKVVITGNLKLAVPMKKLSEKEKEAFRKTLGLSSKDRIITVGSTHQKEEELLIEQIKKVPNIKFILVPRHPERFQAVKKRLEQIGNGQILLVDQMGVLTQCYHLSEIAIVGGSFIPKVGGHNIFEPIQAEIPVFFGPYMNKQKELAHMVIEAKAGIQVSIENLAESLQQALTDLSILKKNAIDLSLKGEEAYSNTWKVLERISCI